MSNGEQYEIKESKIDEAHQPINENKIAMK